MPDNTQPINPLHRLLDYDARKFTSAEIQLEKSLENWIEKASSLQFKIVLQKYHAFVGEHIKKMEVFFEEEEISSLSSSNRIMNAFIEECNEKLNNCPEQVVRDAGLLASVQAINHFKISVYGTAAAFAKELGMEKFAAAFHEYEVNEKQIDDRLSQLAEHEINMKAKATIELHS
jgi:ferritin-like metal-binding protein YciE